MLPVFADTGYFIASLNDRDELHERAADITESLTPFRMVTTQMVLGEVLDQMSSGGERRRTLAAQFVADLQNNPDVEIVPQTDEQFRDALERYIARPDQRWSLTDCASFLTMERRGITDALAHDRDFEQAGFVALLRADQPR